MNGYYQVGSGCTVTITHDNPFTQKISQQGQYVKNKRTAKIIQITPKTQYTANLQMAKNRVYDHQKRWEA